MNAQPDQPFALPIVAAIWIVVNEADWSGVNDCGAIFVPDRSMKFEIDDDWPIEQSS